MRIRNDEHREALWRVHAIAADFQLLDVWRFPIEGVAADGGDFDSFVQVLKVSTAVPDKGAAATLFRFRMWLGKVFGWDQDARALPIPGCQETSVKQRLPPDLAGTGRLDSDNDFKEVYRTNREVLNEISNSTVHALMHLGWVELEPGHFTGQMAVYVKPRGLLGQLYMWLITPFRLAIVYPAMMRHVARKWEARPLGQPVGANVQGG